MRRHFRLRKHSLACRFCCEKSPEAIRILLPDETSPSVSSGINTWFHIRNISRTKEVQQQLQQMLSKALWIFMTYNTEFLRRSWPLLKTSPNVLPQRKPAVGFLQTLQVVGYREFTPKLKYYCLYSYLSCCWSNWVALLKNVAAKAWNHNFITLKTGFSSTCLQQSNFK